MSPVLCSERKENNPNEIYMDNLLASLFVKQHHNVEDEENKAENTEKIIRT